MARKATPTKAKEPVKIRTKKLANGNESIFLDFAVNGKRIKEYLKLYLVPAKTQADKIANANTLQAALAIKAQRTNDIIMGKAGLENTNSLGRIPLLDWIAEFAQMPHGDGKSKGYLMECTCLAKHLQQMGVTRRLELCQVDANFFRKFSHYLQYDAHILSRGRPCKDGTPGKRTNRKLGLQTAHSYFSRLNEAMLCAVRKGLINKNPGDSLDKREKVPKPEPHRDYLTLEELQKLMNTPGATENVNRAFLFGCLCGLRISDIKALKWENIHQGEQGKYAEIKVIKTRKNLIVPLNDDALMLPTTNPKDKTAPLFELPSHGRIGQIMKRWAQNSGINKHITFHTSRHTFATLQLTMGTDLYTICKMLGHSNIQTTQIYAEIIGKKKSEAANRLQGLITLNK